MPVKQKPQKSHHRAAHHKVPRTKGFMKVYAPYIPLLVIVGASFSIANHSDMQIGGQVQSYAINMTDDGLLEETNAERVSKGLKPLTFNSDLDAAAQLKAQDMASKNYWAHNTPDGKEPWYFIEQTEYTYRKAAENLAYGFNSSKTALGGWMNSPGHRANILDADLQEVGFGIINIPNYQDRGPETLVVAMYGQPAVAAASKNAAPIPATVKPPVAVASNQPQSISFAQSVTNGKAPWIGFLAGSIIGSIIMYLAVAHIRGVRRALRTSENFVIHHPILDLTLVALIVLAVIATQSIGSIY